MALRFQLPVSSPIAARALAGAVLPALRGQAAGANGEPPEHDAVARAP
jgi:hypothetical protein